MKTYSLLLSTALLIGAGFSASGQTKIWTGGGDGVSWTNAANWSGGLPGALDNVFITNGAGTTVVVLSDVTVRSVQCSKGVRISGGSLTVTGGASQFTGAFTLTNDAALTASGLASLTVTGATTDNDGSFTALAGATLSFPNLQVVTNGSYNPTWRADGAGSAIDLSMVTNLGMGISRTLYVQVYNGGTIDLHRLTNTTACFDIDARDSGSLVNLSGLIGRWKSGGNYRMSLEAQTGATILMPNVTQLEFANLTIDDTGAISTAQLTLLTNVALTVNGSAPNFNRVTNIDDTWVYAYNGGVALLTNVSRVNHNSQNPTWRADGAGCLVDLSRLTNVTMNPSRTLYVQTYNGGAIDLHRLVSQTATFDVDARDSGSVVDLSGLTGRWKSSGNYRMALEAQSGASILMPNVTQLEFASLRVDDTGVVSTAQLNLFTNVDLRVDGSAPNFNRVTNIDDTWVYAYNGGVALLTNVGRVFHNSQNPTWYADASSLIDVSRLTNLTMNSSRTLYLQTYTGGAIDLHRLANPTSTLDVYAQDTGSVIDLSGLVGRWKSGPNYRMSIEAKGSGAILIPNVTQLEYAYFRVDDTGVIPTAQLNLLTNVSLTTDGSAPNFNRVTNIDDTWVYAYNGGVALLTNVGRVFHNSQNPTWCSQDPGSLIDLSRLTNLTMNSSRTLYVQAYNGGVVDLHRLANPTATLDLDARDAGSVIDLSGLTGRWKSGPTYRMSLQAQTGASILIPNVTQLEFASLEIDDTGVISTAQLTLLTNVQLTVDAATPNFNRLTNIDDTSVYAYNGGVARLTNVFQVAHISQNPTWRGQNTNSLVDLSRLTNLVMNPSRTLYLQAYNSGGVDLRRLANPTSCLDIDARDPYSVVNLSGIAGRWKNTSNYRLSLEAQTGGSILIPNVTQMEFGSLRVDNTGTISTAQLNLLTNMILTVDASAPNFGGVTNIDDTSVYAYNAGIARLTNVCRVAEASQNPTWHSEDPGSLIDLSSLTNLSIATYRTLYVQAYSGGDIDLHRLPVLCSGAAEFLADGTGSTIDLSGLTSLMSWGYASGLTAQNSGVILFNSQAFLLANVAINIPAGNPILPTTLIASPTMVLYGTPWHSYWIEKRDPWSPFNPWVFAQRVPLTNSFQAIIAAPVPQLEYRVWDFVADYPFVDFFFMTNRQIQPVIYDTPGMTNQHSTTTNLAKPSWQTNTVTMTNAFRLLTTPTDPMRFYRVKRL